MSHKKAWTHCHVCAREIVGENCEDEFEIESYLAPRENAFYDIWGPGLRLEYQLRTIAKFCSNSRFHLCPKCSKEFEVRLKRLIKRFEKEFGSKKRWMAERRRR